MEDDDNYEVGFQAETIFKPDLGGSDESQDELVKLTESNSLDADRSSEDEEDEESLEEKVVDPGEAIPSFVCPRCKTTFSTNNSMLGSSCVYCNGRGVNKGENQFFGGSSYLPFVKTMKDAVAAYKKVIRFNPLIPFEFRGGVTLKKIRKLYLVCNLSDYNVDGSISFVCGDKIQNVKAAPMQTFDTSYTTSFQFNRFLSSGYSKLGDDMISNINNYNFTSKQPFQSSITKDGAILVSEYDRDTLTKRDKEKIIKHVTGIVRGNIQHTNKKVNVCNLDIKPSSCENVLIPIYYLNLKKDGKNHFFLMNGQTGKTIEDLPTSIVSVIVFSLLCFAILFLITFLITRLF